MEHNPETCGCKYIGMNMWDCGHTDQSEPNPPYGYKPMVELAHGGNRELNFWERPNYYPGEVPVSWNTMLDEDTGIWVTTSYCGWGDELARHKIAVYPENQFHVFHYTKFDGKVRHGHVCDRNGVQIGYTYYREG